MILSSGNDQKNYVLIENELVLYEAEKTIKPKKRVNNIYSIFLDNDEKLWLGSDGGLFCLDKGIWKIYDNVLSLVEEHEDVKGSEPTVSYIFKDTEGNTWFNFSNCIVRYDEQKFYLEKAVKWPGPPFQDSKGTIWIGYREGVFQYKDGEWDQFENSDGMEDVFEPSRIGEDRDGNIWYLSRLKLPSAKGGKIYKYDGSSWESFTIDKKGSIFDLYIDSNGDPWCATINGAFKYQEKEWVEMHSLNFTTNYLSIFEDSRGDLWFGADSFTGRLDRYTPE